MKAIFVPKWLAEAKARDLSDESGAYKAEFTDLCGSSQKDQLVFEGVIEKETERAIQISTGICDVTGNERSWKIWLPKSQIINMVDIKEV